MATVLQFELSADDIERITTVPGATRKVGICAGILAVVGVVGLAAGAAASQTGPLALGAVALVIAALFGALLWRIPRSQAAMAARLTGPAKVRFTDAGVQYTGVELAENFGWDRVSVINDRPEGWVMTVQAVGSLVIPKSAVSAKQSKDFAVQLKTWARGRYRIRRR